MLRSKLHQYAILFYFMLKEGTSLSFTPKTLVLYGKVIFLGEKTKKLKQPQQQHFCTAPTRYNPASV